MSDWNVMLAAAVLNKKLEIYTEEMTILNDCLELLYEDAEKLNKIWRGYAAEAFLQNMNENKETAKILLKKLNNQIIIIQTAEAGFTECELKISEIIHELPVPY